MKQNKVLQSKINKLMSNLHQLRLSSKIFLAFSKYFFFTNNLPSTLLDITVEDAGIINQLFSPVGNDFTLCSKVFTLDFLHLLTSVKIFRSLILQFIYNLCNVVMSYTMLCKKKPLSKTRKDSLKKLSLLSDYSQQQKVLQVYSYETFSGIYTTFVKLFARTYALACHMQYISCKMQISRLIYLYS